MLEQIVCVIYWVIFLGFHVFAAIWDLSFMRLPNIPIIIFFVLRIPFLFLLKEWNVFTFLVPLIFSLLFVIMYFVLWNPKRKNSGIGGGDIKWLITVSFWTCTGAVFYLLAVCLGSTIAFFPAKKKTGVGLPMGPVFAFASVILLVVTLILGYKFPQYLLFAILQRILN